MLILVSIFFLNPLNVDVIVTANCAVFDRNV